MRKKWIKSNTKSEGTHYIDLSLEMAILYQFAIFLQKLNQPWTKVETDAAITTQPEESKENNRDSTQDTESNMVEQNF